MPMTSQPPGIALPNPWPLSGRGRVYGRADGQSLILERTLGAIAFSGVVVGLSRICSRLQMVGQYFRTSEKTKKPNFAVLGQGGENIRNAEKNS